MDICYPELTDWASNCGLTEQEVQSIDQDTRERVEALAWLTLQSLTGYRLSLCPTLIRPCVARCGRQTWEVAPVEWGGYFRPFLYGGGWYNGCGCMDECECIIMRNVILPSEVASIAEVWVDGALLPSTAYRVDNGNRLVRTDGEAWPMCQDYSNSNPAVGGFFVTYYSGIAPNDLLRYAAGILAGEFYRACANMECRLPVGITNISRAGVSMEIEPGSFPSGMTGIHEVDAIIRIYNPYGIKARAKALSPDSRRGRITTWRP